MTGMYIMRIIDNHSNTEYQLQIKRKITIITGDSATGKSVIYDLIQENEASRRVFKCENGVNRISTIKVVAANLDDIYFISLDTEPSIVILDEQFPYKDNNVINYIKESNSYFIIITRNLSSLSKLPFSMSEIYTIGFAKKLKSRQLNRIYNVYTMKKLYNLDSVVNSLIHPIVVTEDSKSGYEFFMNALPNNKVYSAYGKNKFVDIIRNKCIIDINANQTIYLQGNECLIFIVDSAAFGSCIDSLLQVIGNSDFKVTLICPESFEYLLLSVVDVKDRKYIDNILNRTYDYLDVTVTDCGNNTFGEDNYYGSWEIFYTNRLKEFTNNTIFRYSKDKLNKEYLRYKDIILNRLGINILCDDKLYESYDSTSFFSE